MMRRGSIGLVFVLALAAIATPFSTATPRASAQSGVTLKFATLFPANSSLMRSLQAWGQSVNEHTNHGVTLEFVSLGRTANERAFVTGMRDGTYDGAVLTASGIQALAPGALALGAPGVITDYERLTRVRTALSSDLNAVFASAPNGGYKLLGWADYGRARLFSTAPIAAPAALSGRKLWASQDDVIGAAIASAGHATRVNNGVGQVAQAIDSHAIDTVYASSIAAVSLNWHRDGRLRFVSEQSFGIIVGATVLKSAAYASIPSQYRAAFDQDTAQLHTALNRTIRRDDDRNYETAISRGVTAFSTTPNASAWNATFATARGTLNFPAALMGRIAATR